MPHKRCKRSQRRQVGMGIGHNTYLGAGRPVEHPGWNLKPTVGIGTAKITAKNNSVRPVDRLVNSDLSSSRNSVPWVFSSFVVQRGSTPLGLRRQDARRSLCYPGKPGEIGGVIEPRIYLSQAAILSRQAGPPLRFQEYTRRERLQVHQGAHQELREFILSGRDNTASAIPLTARAVERAPARSVTGQFCISAPSMA